MKKIVGVSFKENGKIYYFNCDGFNLDKDNFVIVETDKGLRFGKVVTNIKSIEDDSLNNNLDNIIRIATKEDIRQDKKNVENSKLALEKAKKIAGRLDLNMNFIDASYTFDRNQLVFYFLADNRVDFRELAKELARIYKTRIELRQIGARDKAKEISGIGPCGRQLCCSCFLNDLDSVTINMAKNQNIALNPNKINGACGRLLCCFNYEDEMYFKNREGMPEIGQMIMTDFGEGMVISVDILNRKYVVNISNVGKTEIKMPSKCDTCEKCNK